MVSRIIKSQWTWFLSAILSFLLWGHAHAAEPIVKNRAEIRLVRAIYKTDSDILRVEADLSQYRSNRTQVLISLNPESPQPHLVELKNSLEERIADLQRSLDVLLESQQELKTQERLLLGS